MEWTDGFLTLLVLRESMPEPPLTAGAVSALSAIVNVVGVDGCCGRCHDRIGGGRVLCVTFLLSHGVTVSLGAGADQTDGDVLV